MERTIQRSESEINELLNKAAEGLDIQPVRAYIGSRFPGMSYEEGIVNTLSWLFGDFDNPMDD